MISRAWLIGSLAWGRFGPTSDADVVVEGVSAEDIDTLWGRLGADLPVELDLLRLEDLPQDFRERVLTTRRPAIKPPHASQYVKHIQDLLTHGLAAERPGVRKRA